jgi:hypothetical protein
MITKELQSILEQQYLNKFVSIKTNQRDNKGNIIPNQFFTVSGYCTYIGANQYLNWNLQVTLDNLTPYKINHINDIQFDTPHKNLNRSF